jgi:chaperonin GroEL
MEKKVSYSKEAREELLSGVKQLADAVVATLGPSGRNVIIEQEMGNPVSTKDGVTVAKAIELEDKVPNIGAQLVKQASIKTAEEAGDGTTTSTLLAYSIANSPIDDTDNVVEIKRGVDKAVTAVVDYLAERSEEITDEEQLKQVATISANNDTEVGELISTAMDKVGRDGVVTIEESRTGETYLETVEGMQFGRGYKSPYFVTDNSTMQAVLQSPLILITDKRLNSVKELLPVLEACSSQNKSLLIIADDIDGEALSTLVVNKMRGILSCVAVKAPEFGDRKKAILEDIAVLTGGQVISTEKGMKLEKFNPDWLGKAKKVTVGKETTTIIDASGDEEKIKQRVEELKTQIEESKSPFEKENLQDRLGKFIGGVAIVHVGGHTEVEMKEKKDRVDDALHATRAALEEGILPGGGIALLNASKMLDSAEIEVTHPSQALGIQFVKLACRKPFIKILQNAGYANEEIAEVLNNLEKANDGWMGYNPRTGKIVNMFQEGIIDPAKVTRLALENAASVAGTILLTEAVISNIKKDKEEKNDFGGMM